MLQIVRVMHSRFHSKAHIRTDVGFFLFLIGFGPPYPLRAV